MSRRSLSTRRRYEILERDDFTCQYCGRSAPDVPLEVEHIHPVSRGGGNEAWNLLTACWECNSGKSDLLRREDARDMDDRMKFIGRYWCDHYMRAKQQWTFSVSRRAVVKRFYVLMPKGDLREAINQTFRVHRPTHADREPDGAWDYFCALCWTRIEQLNWL